MLRALTKVRTDGRVYTRRPAIEAKLHELLALDRDTLSERLLIRDYKSADYVPSECLIYLLREAKFGNSRQWFNTLYTRLIERCTANLLRSVSAGVINDAPSVREDIIDAIKDRLVAGLSDEPEVLDPLEVAFNRVFQTMRFDGVKRALRRQGRYPLFNHQAGEDKEDPDRWIQTIRQEEAAEEYGMSNSEWAVFRKQILAAIEALPDTQRQPILLRLEGLPLHSEDPAVDTVEKRLNVEERTLRNRIKRGVRLILDQSGDESERDD